MIQLILQYMFYLFLTIGLAIPLGKYICKVMNGEKVWLSKVISPCEKIIYKILGVKEEEQMSWKKYLLSVLTFNGVGLLVLFVLQMCQGALGGNPQHIPGLRWDLSFNAAISFVTNTNWQAYQGETQLSYLSQALGLTVQNFVSAGTGIAVLFAFIRGFVKVQQIGLGSFWVDLTRAVWYILLPLAIMESLFLISQGVPQTGKAAQTVQLVEPIAVDENGEVIENAKIIGNKVIVEGTELEKAQIITKEMVPLGYAASQVAIKQLGTNGGGYYGANSAHPLENPSWWSNLMEMLSILLIPVALCFAYGRTVNDKKQGTSIFCAMLIVLVVALLGVAVSEQTAQTVLSENAQVDVSTVGQAGGNMEGKESRFGIAASTTWSVFTTAASNGSINAMHDSYTPLGGMILMLLIQLGEVIFGGVGCGLYGMLSFIILTVFIAGLMVGRTPEYLGKKIEPYEMKWAVLICLTTPMAILVGSGIAVVVPSVAESIHQTGAHGFSEILYAYSSASGNNGSAFAGIKADTVFLNISLGICMLFTRFVPIIGILSIAGKMVQKKKLAITAGTLSTSNGKFVFLLILIVLLIGALSFFPALALGPLAEFFS